MVGRKPHNTDNPFLLMIGIVFAILIVYAIIGVIRIDVVGTIGIITKFLFIGILLLAIPAMLYIKDLPEDLPNFVILGTIGWFIFIILNLFSSLLSLYFGFIYSIFVLYMIDSTNKILYYRND